MILIFFWLHLKSDNLRSKRQKKIKKTGSGDIWFLNKRVLKSRPRREMLKVP